MLTKRKQIKESVFRKITDEPKEITVPITDEEWKKIYGPSLKTRTKLVTGWMEVTDLILYFLIANKLKKFVK